MAEYNDVIKQFKRMCWYYSRDKMQKSCPMCTSYPNCNIGQCRKIAFEKPTHFATTVTRWAAEHPEPVYPTWGDWLAEMGLICWEDNGDRDGVYSVMTPTFKMCTPIPADIAGKLGLQPKE